MWEFREPRDCVANAHSGCSLTLKHICISATSYVLVFLAIDMMTPPAHTFLLCVFSNVTVIVLYFQSVRSDLRRAFFQSAVARLV